MFIPRLILSCLFLLQPLGAWAQQESYGLTAQFDRAGSYVAIAPNMRKPVLHSLELRRALATLVNITVYNDLVFKGRLSPFSSIFNGTKLDEGAYLTPDIVKAIDSYASSGGDEAVYKSVIDALLEDRFSTSIGSNREQDREKLRAAKAILDESVYLANANGDRVDPRSGEPLRLKLFVPSTYSSNALRVTAQILATNLEFLGIKVEIEEGLPSQITNFDFDFALFTMGQPQTSFDLWKQYSSVFSNTPDTYNFSGLDDPIVDFLLSRLDHSANAEEFAAVAKGLDHTLINLNYIIPVGWWAFDYSSLPSAPDHRPQAAKTFKAAYELIKDSDQKRTVAAQKACDYGAHEMCDRPRPENLPELTLMEPPEKGEDTEMAQHMLAQLLYDTGKPDGAWGPRSQKALDAFALDYRWAISENPGVLKETGEVGALLQTYLACGNEFSLRDNGFGDQIETLRSECDAFALSRLKREVPHGLNGLHYDAKTISIAFSTCGVNMTEKLFRDLFDIIVRKSGAPDYQKRWQTIGLAMEPVFMAPSADGSHCEKMRGAGDNKELMANVFVAFTMANHWASAKEKM